MTITLTLNEDGTGAFDIYGEKTDVTWEGTDMGCTIYLDGEPAEAVLSDNNLTLDVQDGDYMVFQKAAASSTGLAA